MDKFPTPFVWAEKHKSASSNSGTNKAASDEYIGELPNYPKTPIIKFVKKAKMWVTTHFDTPHRGRGGRITLTQRQEWSSTKPVGKR